MLHGGYFSASSDEGGTHTDAHVAGREEGGHAGGGVMSRNWGQIARLFHSFEHDITRFRLWVRRDEQEKAEAEKAEALRSASAAAAARAATDRRASRSASQREEEEANPNPNPSPSPSPSPNPNNPNPNPNLTPNPTPNPNQERRLFMERYGGATGIGRCCLPGQG